MNEGSIELPTMRLVEVELALLLVQDCSLPRHGGALLRGGMALLLKRSVCVYPHFTHCRDCQLRHRCVYPAVFEPAPPPDSVALRTHQDVPLPFVLRLPGEWQPRYRAGDEVTFGLVLVGSAIRYLAYLIAAVEHLGQSGLGSERVRFRLQKVVARQPSGALPLTVYEAGLMFQGEPSFAVADLPAGGLTHPTRLPLDFLAPTRLKHADDFVRVAPPFPVLIRTLLRRVSSLSYFHAGQRWETDYRGWIAQAEGVDIEQADVQWVDWERYSTRQERRMNLGGIVGSVTYRGEIEPFLPLLRLGALVHVGKGAVFGNGQYRLME